MKKHAYSTLLIWTLSVSILTTLSAQDIDKDLWQKAMKIHNDAIVMDAHAHALLFGVGRRDQLDLGKKDGKSQIDFISMKEGGLDALFLSVPLPGDKDAGNSSKKILDDVRLIRQQIETYGELAELALTPGDIRKNHALGKRAIVFSTEYPRCLEGHSAMLDAYYAGGIRMITLSTDSVDQIAESVDDAGGNEILSPYGREVIGKMNRLGMLIDITHTSDDLQKDIIEFSRAPVVASHSCMRSVVDISRNIPDDILQSLAKKGGAVMITFYSGYLSNAYRAESERIDKLLEAERIKLKEQYPDDPDEVDKQVNAMEEKLAPPKAGIENLIDHIDHAVKVAGADHVGIGSDFGGINVPVGLETAAGFPLITTHLLKRGYTENDIAKIMGGNLLRVFEEVQRTAQHIQKSD